MSVRIVLVLGFAAVLIGLGIDMSRSAPRTAGSNLHRPAVFVAKVPPGGVLCQPSAPLPPDARRALMVMGTYGHPVPPGSVRFISSSGSVSAQGDLPAGATEGPISVSLTQIRGAAPAAHVCVRPTAQTAVALGGEPEPAGPQSERINGVPAPGIVSIIYERPGKESQWQLLPTLVHRFGRGKASFFGDWTLPACIVVVLGVWIGAARLLVRELR
jgi:hypothetical protein